MRWAVTAATALMATAAAGQVVDQSASKLDPSTLSRVVLVLRAEVDDPSSLQIRRLRSDAKGLRVCGEYNIRTERGGYHPFRSFTVAQEVAVIEPNDRDVVSLAVRDMIKAVCTKL